MKIEELELELNKNSIYFEGETFKYTKPQLEKLVKAVRAEYGKKSVDTTLEDAILSLKKPVGEFTEGTVETYKSPEDLLFKYIFPQNNLHYDAEHEILINEKSGMSINDSDLANIITSSNYDYKCFSSDEAIRVKDNILISRFNKLRRQEFDDSVIELQERIKYKPHLKDKLDIHLDELLEAMNISNDFYSIEIGYKTDKFREVTKLVIKQIIWLIKRNVNNLPTKNEIMLFFFGEQGIGKSYAFEKMFRFIFKGLYISDCKLETLLEDRQVDLFTRKFVINFDDASMQGNSFNTKNMGEIKAKLSNNTITYRPMGSNTARTDFKKFTAVSTTNLDFKELIQDSTGARRFFQMTSDNKENEIFDKEYFDANDIDEKMRELWCSVDENDKNGFLFNKDNKLISILEKIQESYIKLEPVQLYIKDRCIATSGKNIDKLEKVSFSKLFDDYLEFCDDNNITGKKNKPNFFKSLSDNIYFDENKMKNGKWGKYAFMQTEIESDDILVDTQKVNTDKYKDVDIDFVG